MNDGRIDPAADDNAALLVAVLNDNLMAIKILLLDARVNPAVFKPRHSPIVAAATRPWETGVLELLLRDGRVDPGVEGNAALIAAITAQNGYAIKALLADARVNPNEAEPEAPIVCAARIGSRYCLLLLLDDPRVDPTLVGGTLRWHPRFFQ